MTVELWTVGHPRSSNPLEWFVPGRLFFLSRLAGPTAHIQCSAGFLLPFGRNLAVWNIHKSATMFCTVTSAVPGGLEGDRGRGEARGQRARAHEGPHDGYATQPRRVPESI